MTTLADYIDKLNPVSLAAWFAALLLFIFFSSYLREAVVYVLIKLYDFFIGSKGHLSPD